MTNNKTEKNVTNEAQDEAKSEVYSRDSIVGISNIRKRLTTVAMLLVSVVMMWYIISDDSGQKKPVSSRDTKENKKEINKLLEESETAPQNFETKIEAVPKLPTPPPLLIPAPPPPPVIVPQAKKRDRETFAPPPPPPPPPPPTSAPSPRKDFVPLLIPGEEKTNTTDRSRRNSNMIAFGGGGDGGTTGGISNIDVTDPSSIGNIVNKDTIKGIRSIFSDEASHPSVDAYPEQTSSPQTAATYSGPREYIIAQGKIIDIVLETAIDTDLPGVIRGIISRDVYSESGRSVLIPKGSRVIGEYDSEVQHGEVRLGIVWSRVILPDGIDIKIDSVGVDQLGRAGIEADEVDTKFFQLVRNALMFTAITLGSDTALTKISGNDGSGTISTEKDKDGNITTTGRSKDLALSKATEELSSIFKDYIKKQSNPNPTMRINQGMPMKAFVNQDLIFSKHINKITRR